MKRNDSKARIGQAFARHKSRLASLYFFSLYGTQGASLHGSINLRRFSRPCSAENCLSLLILRLSMRDSLPFPEVSSRSIFSILQDFWPTVQWDFLIFRIWVALLPKSLLLKEKHVYWPSFDGLHTCCGAQCSSARKNIIFPMKSLVRCPIGYIWSLPWKHLTGVHVIGCCSLKSKSWI